MKIALKTLYGINDEREALLKQKGFDPRIVQRLVNRMKG